VERKEGRTSERVQVLRLPFNKRATDKAHLTEVARKTNKVVGCAWGIGERKWRGDFRRRMMMFESMVESVSMYRAEIWGWKEQEEVERVQQKYLGWLLGVDRETPGYIVEKEQAASESRKEGGKVWRQNGWKGRVEPIDRMLGGKEKEQGVGERELLPEERVCQWRSGKIESERNKDTNKQERKRESKNQGTTGSIRGVRQRKFWRISGKWVQEREKWWRDSDVGTRREKTGIGRKERTKGAECATRRVRMDATKWEKGTGRNTERRRKGDRTDERDMEQEGQNRKRKRWEIERKMFFYLFFWNCYFYV
jgi:hypothetical protein